MILWAWKNIDEETGQLIGDSNTKHEQSLKTVKIDDIELIEAIRHSNPRWHGIVTNEFNFDKFSKKTHY